MGRVSCSAAPGGVPAGTATGRGSMPPGKSLGGGGANLQETHSPPSCGTPPFSSASLSLLSSLGSFWAVVLLVGLVLLPTCHPEEGQEQQQSSSSRVGPFSYGIVIDAGSSGTRMRIYEWTETSNCVKLPAFAEIVNHKLNPGISSFIHDVDGLGNYLAKLMDKAKLAVPPGNHARTPLYLMATAGMRLLLEPHANAVMNKLKTLLLDDVFNPFMYESRNSRILSGEEEGAFAWIAVNYLTGYFSGDASESAGILELGGASTQIAFLPDGAILADKWPMKIGQKSYALYVHSYLFYGQELTVRWAKQHLVRINPANTTIINPCMLRGDNQTETIMGRTVTLMGTSDPDGCKKIVDTFVYKAPDYNCHPKPCAISTVYQPTIGASKQFYALSAFLFNLRDIQALDDQGRFTPAGTTAAARSYCSKTFSEVKEEIGGNEAFLSSNCLMGLYIPTLFTKGYGFAQDTQQIIALKKVKDTSLEWSLGAIIYEHEHKDRVCAPRESAVCGTSSAPATASCSPFTLFVGLSLVSFLI